MMTAATKEIQSFCEFAEQRLRDVESDFTLDDLYMEWRACNPCRDALEKSVAAVRGSLRDMEKGETGRAVGEFRAEFRQRNGI